MHPRQRPGGRSTDPGDLPAERTAYALRDLDHLRRLAAGHGPVVGAFAVALLDTPLPWTKMRQVYALLGLVGKWGADRVDTACASALAHEAINVGLIGRMLERGTENTTGQPPLPGVVVSARFAHGRPRRGPTRRLRARSGTSGRSWPWVHQQRTSCARRRPPGCEQTRHRRGLIVAPEGDMGT